MAFPSHLEPPPRYPVKFEKERRLTSLSDDERNNDQVKVVSGANFRDAR